MFCTNCGKELAEGTKFCTNCGKALDGESVQIQPAAVNQSQQAYAQQPQYQSFQGQPQQAVNYSNGQFQNNPVKKKSKKGLIIALSILAAVAVLVIGAFFATRLSEEEQQMVNNVTESIDSIGIVTEDSEEAIASAEELYAELNWKERLYIKNSDTLKQARSSCNDLRVNKMTAMIDNIGEVTLESGNTLDAAKQYYEILTDEQKALVTNYADLETALAAYDDLLVEDAIAKIDAIGTITIESSDSIEAAKEAYDKLSDELKARVTNADVLTEADAVYTATLIQDCIDKIDAIGEVTLDSEDQINTASETYNNLPEDLKSEVSNYSELVASVAAYEELVEAEKLKEMTLSKGDTVTNDTFSITYKGSSVTDKILPNNTSGSYSYYYITDDDYTMLDMVFTVENLTSSSQSLFFTIGDIEVTYGDDTSSYLPTFVIANGSEVTMKLLFDTMEASSKITLHVVVELPKEAKKDGQPISVMLKVTDEQKYIVVR